MAIDWGKVLPQAIGAGSSLAGGILQSRAANKGTNLTNDYLSGQVTRKNAAQDQLMRVLGLPSLGGGGGGSMAGGMASRAPQMTQAGPGGLSKGLGLAGTGMSIAGSVAPSLIGGALGIGASAVPIVGPALGALAFGLSKVGQGRKTANNWVKQYQEPFDKSGHTPTDVNNYKAAINAMINAGGNQQKVGTQALDTARKYYGDMFA